MVRIITYVLALALTFASTQAAPTPEPSHASPALFSHDPYSIHRRSLPLVQRDEQESNSESGAETQVDLTEEGSCSTECGVRTVSGVKNEREALCSPIGLEATRVCAECIDTAFPHTRFQKSAMSEYEKIVASCGV